MRYILALAGTWCTRRIIGCVTVSPNGGAEHCTAYRRTIQRGRSSSGMASAER
jgi:hypothetical protein